VAKVVDLYPQPAPVTGVMNAVETGDSAWPEPPAWDDVFVPLPSQPNGHDTLADEIPPNLGESARQEEGKQPKFPLIAWPDITFEPDEEWRVEGLLPHIGLGASMAGQVPSSRLF
jgi:hypothetical protein